MQRNSLSANSVKLDAAHRENLADESLQRELNLGEHRHDEVDDDEFEGAFDGEDDAAFERQFEELDADDTGGGVDEFQSDHDNESFTDKHAAFEEGGVIPWKDVPGSMKDTREDTDL